MNWDLFAPVVGTILAGAASVGAILKIGPQRANIIARGAQKAVKALEGSLDELRKELKEARGQAERAEERAIRAEERARVAAEAERECMKQAARLSVALQTAQATIAENSRRITELEAQAGGRRAADPDGSVEPGG